MLEHLGFSPFFEESFRLHGAHGLLPGRVVFASREIARLLGAAGEVIARPAGRLRHGSAALPVTGDWVAYRQTAPGEGLVEVVLPRRGALTRKEPGRQTARQLLAANVDVALLVQPADRPNARSLERYAALAWSGGALPVVVVTKSDLSPGPGAALAAAESAAPGVAVHAVSARTGVGLGVLATCVPFGTTAALLGPSGGGKSTLVNALVGTALQATAAVRESDGRGRHTTTAREMVPLPSGGWLLDTPGLRELGVLEGAEAPFGDLEALGASCRFRDCRHEAEPGCAVVDAVRAGGLDAARLDSFRKLRREAERVEELAVSTAAAVEKRRWREITRAARIAGSAKRSW